MSFTGAVYALASRLAGPLAKPWLRQRATKGKEDAARLGERFGKTKAPRPNGPLIWMHGASVGETMMLLPLIEQLLAANPNRHVLVTSGTLTSASLMAERLPERAFHQFVPLDLPAAVNRFLDHWQPDLAIWAESDIWPNLITLTARRAIPMALINARMSKKSLSGWARRGAFAKTLFGHFNLIHPADRRTAEGLSLILGRNISAVGNLKSTLPKPDVDGDELQRLRGILGTRPIWVAASTHAPEIPTILKAAKANPTATLVWVPRHPETAAFIKAQAAGLNLAQRSRGHMPDAQTDIYLFDTLGEMGTALSLGDVCVMGGSFSAELMGHNPLEPVRLDIATLTGPHFASFADIYAPLIQSGAVKVIDAPDNLGEEVGRLLDDPTRRDIMIAQARKSAQAQAELLPQTLAALEALL